MIAKAVVSRILASLGVLVVIAALVFVLARVAPGDPARTLAGTRATDDQVAAMRDNLGLDRSLPEQFGIFLGDVAHGDLGTSHTTGRPVLDDLREYAPATLELALAAFVIALLLGVGLGMVGVRRGAASGWTRLVSIVGAAIPPYVAALALVLIFGVGLGWLPTSGRIDAQYAAIPSPTGSMVVDSALTGDPAALLSALRHLVLPATAIALVPMVAISRTLRTCLSTVLAEDYAISARAKGLSHTRVILRHGLRNAAGPVLSMAGLQLGAMLGGVVVVEQLCNWGGLGQYLVQALALLDYPAVLGVVLVFGAAYVLINAAVDVAQVVADPRLRVEVGS